MDLVPRARRRGLLFSSPIRNHAPVPMPLVCGFRFIPAGYSEREAGHRSDLKPATIPK